MRRFMLITLTAAALCLGAGCGSDEDKPAPKPDETQVEGEREMKSIPGKAIQKARDVQDAAAEHDKQLQELIDQQP